MNTLRLIILFVLLPFSGWCQKGFWFSKLSKTDTAYIKSYSEEVTTKFLFSYESTGFWIQPSGQNIPIKYTPNTDIKNGFEVHHNWWGVGLTVNNPFAGGDNWKKGSSSIFDLRIKAYGNALATEITIQNQRGFYLQNINELDSEWKSDDVFPQRSDLRIFSIGIIGYYISNYKEHSFRAAYIHNERQLKSSGSFVYSPSFVYLNVRSNNSLIPQAYLDKFEVKENEHIQAGKFVTFGLSAGYSYTHIIGKYFYYNVSFIPGFFLQTYNYKTENEGIKGANPTFLWLGRSAIGFNNDTFFFGIGGVWGFKNTKLDIGQSNFNYNMNQIRVWFGTRFKVPKIKIR
jgi:hypothetical protein